MTLEDISSLALTRGISSLVFVVMSLIIGIKIILNYAEYKQKTHITVGGSKKSLIPEKVAKLLIKDLQ